MRNICFFLVIIGLTIHFSACSSIDFDFDDPQETQTIQEAFFFENSDNLDLIELFGEENIHFGPVPPSFGDSISFLVDGMYYDTCIRYVFGPDGNTFPSQTAPPDYDASKNRHLFYDKTQGIFKHKMNTLDTYNNTYHMDLKKAYVIGHDSLFTTYYIGQMEGNGDPTVALIISGTLVFDKNNEFLGVKDYLFGKKILNYSYHPTNAYAPGTIEIKKHPGFSPRCEWDPNR